MKTCIFALVVMLHHCYTAPGIGNLNNEIIRKLDSLSKLKNTLDKVESSHLRVPSQYMIGNASDCVGTFVKELKDLLKNVTVEEVLVETLKINLSILKLQSSTPTNCSMEREDKDNVFKKYAQFVRKLNDSKER